MSDFQDFLKRQFTHVAIAEFKPGKFAEAKELYQAAVSTYTNGFKGAFLLQEPGTDRGISVIFWDSVDDMTDNESSAYQAILQKMTPLFAKTPTTALYEVVCEIEPSHQQL